MTGISKGTPTAGLAEQTVEMDDSDDDSSSSLSSQRLPGRAKAGRTMVPLLSFGPPAKKEADALPAVPVSLRLHFDPHTESL